MSPSSFHTRNRSYVIFDPPSFRKQPSALVEPIKSVISILKRFTMVRGVLHPQAIVKSSSLLSLGEWLRACLHYIEIRAKLADIGLVGFARGSIAWEANYIRLLLLLKSVSKGGCGLWKGGCRCVPDESQRACEPSGLHAVNSCI